MVVSRFRTDTQVGAKLDNILPPSRILIESRQIPAAFSFINGSKLNEPLCRKFIV
jgi:hypothetical protein